MSLEAQFASARAETDLGQSVHDFDPDNVSPQEYAEHLGGIVANTLENTRLVEIVEVSAAAGQVHLLGRVKQENERTLVHEVIDSILRQADDIGELFIGKQYFLRDKKLVYGWVFSYGANDLKEATRMVCDAINEAVPPMEVLESPLVGPGTPAGSIGGRGAKGASPVR